MLFLLFVALVFLVGYLVMQQNQMAEELKALNQRLEENDGNLRRLQTKLHRGDFVSTLPPTSSVSKPIVSSEPIRAEEPPAKPVVPPAAPFSSRPRPVIKEIEVERFEAPRPGNIPKARWQEKLPKVDWEKYMGAKLLPRVAAVALLIGILFGIKYSFEHNWISPAARVIGGFLVGLGALVSGVVLRRRPAYAGSSHALCAAGIAVLYVAAFAGRSFYNLYGPGITFLLMVVTTATSFVLSVRLNASFIASLALAGGFLTPLFLSTGIDRPYALFSYILLLDLGAAAVALRQRWSFLLRWAGLATLAMETGWMVRFFHPSKSLLACGIVLVFSALFLAVREVATAIDEQGEPYHAPAAWMPLSSMALLGYLLSFRYMGMHPVGVLTTLMLLSAQLAYLALRRDDLRSWFIAGGSAAFAILSYWTVRYISSELLFSALVFYLVFGVLHAAFPILLLRMRPKAEPFRLGYLGPLAMLGLIFVGMITTDLISFMVWPFVFLIGMLAVAVAWVSSGLVASLMAVALVMGCFAVWLTRMPDGAGFSSILPILMIGACGFFAWGLFVTRRAFTRQRAVSVGESEVSAQLPAASALLPFLLLIMVCFKLPLPNPSEIFGVALLLDVLLLALVRYRALEMASLCALLSTVALLHTWHIRNFDPHQPLAPLFWTTIFYGLFTFFPFVFQKRIKGILPWVTGAAAGPAHFFLVYRIADAIIGRDFIGVVPAFFAVPALVGLYRLLDTLEENHPQRLTLLALYGGVALFFITLIIPLQFSHEWLTLGWALEGAALLWLYRRVPHSGLRVWAMILMTTAFVRLALNPAVMEYHPRSGTLIFNWYLIVYGVAAVAMFVGAWWSRDLSRTEEAVDPSLNSAGVTSTDAVAAPDAELVVTPERASNKRPFDDQEQSFFDIGAQRLMAVLASFGAVLCFLLLNIEIADYFSQGSTLTFHFSGNLAQDMTYSLAWTLFAIVVLIIGMVRRWPKVRLAALVLLAVTVLKVFAHDLMRLGGLYRIGSFVGLAVMLFAVSLMIQRFRAG